MGLLVSDLKRDYIQSHFADLDEITAGEVQARFEALEKSALQELQEEGLPLDQVECERALDLRYGIQKYELTIPVARGPFKESDKATWRGLFDGRHEEHYGTRATDQRVEIVNYRLSARVALPRPIAREHPLGRHDPEPALKGRRGAYFNGWVDCPLYERERLRPGNRLSGPAIIEQVDSTIVIHPGQEAHVDRFGNVIIELLPGGA